MAKSNPPNFLRGKCPNCGRTIRIPKSLVGRTADCPGCTRPIRIAVRKPTKQVDQPAANVNPRQPVPDKAAEPVTNVSTAAKPDTVKVRSPKPWERKHLGIASLMLGLLSSCVFWMPFTALGLSGLGMLLGVAAIIMTVVGRSAGIGYAAAGTAVSATGVLLGILFAFEVRGLTDTVTTIENYLNRGVGAKSARASPSGSKPPADDDPKAAGRDRVVDLPPPDSPQEPAYHDVSQPLQLGNVQLEITDVRIGKVPLYNAIFKEDSWSEAELLTVRITISNTSSVTDTGTATRIDYAGWMSEAASLRNIDATLTDEQGNRCRDVSFGTAKSVRDATTSKSLRPGMSISDAVVFEPPVDGVEYLDLRLSATACDRDGDFRFRIPVETIER